MNTKKEWESTPEATWKPHEAAAKGVATRERERQEREV
jgi:hypothetical protein